jgi:hypothetical protein
VIGTADKSQCRVHLHGSTHLSAGLQNSKFRAGRQVLTQRIVGRTLLSDALGFALMFAEFKHTISFRYGGN